ncbi:MAG: leucine-rich repeat domain-containing protein, partial [Clostridia bacterium]|nr:leucine-rich repeat domain-containing protein [Clostridia bacterium]
MKKTLSFILSLIMVLGVLTSVPVTVSAAMVNGDFEYEYIENDTEVTITKYVGSGGEVYIPNKIDGKYVTAISSGAFRDNSTITYVWMSDYVELIGDYVFSGCTKLKEVEFGAGIKTIGNEAFRNCTSLLTVNLPDSLEEMVHYSYDSGVFEGCTSLKSVVIGDGLKTVSARVFFGCTSLENVVFGKNVEIIGYSAFGDCNNLKEVVLPDSLH